MTAVGTMILPSEKGGSVRTTESRKVMMPQDPRQFEYSQRPGVREYGRALL